MWPCCGMWACPTGLPMLVGLDIVHPVNNNYWESCRLSFQDSKLDLRYNFGLICQKWSLEFFLFHLNNVECILITQSILKSYSNMHVLRLNFKWILLVMHLLLVGFKNMQLVWLTLGMFWIHMLTLPYVPFQINFNLATHSGLIQSFHI
jgi:hypothetical protein